MIDLKEQLDFPGDSISGGFGALILIFLFQIVQPAQFIVRLVGAAFGSLSATGILFIQAYPEKGRNGAG